MSSLTINFVVSSEAGDIYIELDEERNNGRTRFVYGEKAYFKVFYPSNLVLSVTSSDGTIGEDGSGEDVVEEILTFIDSETVAVQKPIKTLVETTWLGNSLGNLSISGRTELTAEQEPDPTSNVAVAVVQYTSNFKRYYLTIGERDRSEYPVVVSVYGRLNN